MEQPCGWCDAIKYHGGAISESHQLTSEVSKDGQVRSFDERRRMAQDQTLAAAVIRGADRTSYGTLVTDLANQVSRGKNDYPNTITAGYSMLVNCRTPTNLQTNNSPLTASGATSIAPAPEASAMTFAQRVRVVGPMVSPMRASHVTTVRPWGSIPPNVLQPGKPSQQRVPPSSNMLSRWPSPLARAESTQLDPL